MCRHPDLVAGTGREDTLLMRAVAGLVAKGGAEGVHVAAHEDGRAVAVKVGDGSERARVPVMLAALRSLGFDVDDVPVPRILGHGHPVGEVTALVGQ
jgi:L-asparaginase II